MIKEICASYVEYDRDSHVSLLSPVHMFMYVCHRLACQVYQLDALIIHKQETQFSGSRLKEERKVALKIYYETKTFGVACT